MKQECLPLGGGDAIIYGTLLTNVSIAKNGSSDNIGQIILPPKGIYLICVNGWNLFNTGSGGGLYDFASSSAQQYAPAGNSTFSMSCLYRATNNATLYLRATNWTNVDYSGNPANIKITAYLLQK